MAVVWISALHVVEGEEAELERQFAEYGDYMLTNPGLEGYELLRPIEGERRYFVYTRWESEQALRHYQTGGGAEAAYAKQAGAKQVTSGIDLLGFDVVLTVDGKDDTQADPAL